MANFSILVALIVALLFSPSLSLSSTPKPRLHTPTIAAAPTILPEPPLSPYTELSPDIAPLLPSPGSTIPTIPSNPSPPNPDEVSSVGPDPAFAPSSGLLQASSAMHLSSRDSAVLLKLLINLIALWLVLAVAL